MPLLTSPIDGTPMRQINRYGVEIDVCPVSGGIWLDKGELEKLMHIIREESIAEQRSFAAIQERAVHHSQKYEKYSGKNDNNHYYKHKGYKKKSKMSKLLDIFDL